MMSTSTTLNTTVPTFDKQILTIFQSVYNSPFDLIMKSHFKDLCEDNVGNRCCRMILVNTLKHYFTDVWMLQVIRNYKIDKLTFINANGALPVTINQLEVLNDDNVNRICGWRL